MQLHSYLVGKPARPPSTARTQRCAAPGRCRLHLPMPHSPDAVRLCVVARCAEQVYGCGHTTHEGPRSVPWSWPSPSRNTRNLSQPPITRLNTTVALSQRIKTCFHDNMNHKILNQYNSILLHNYMYILKFLILNQRIIFPSALKHRLLFLIFEFYSVYHNLY